LEQLPASAVGPSIGNKWRRAVQPVTRTDRESELKSLLLQMEAHPERDWRPERQRVAVLREMLKEPAHSHA
jgi:hypothetical protein